MPLNSLPNAPPSNNHSSHAGWSPLSPPSGPGHHALPVLPCAPDTNSDGLVPAGQVPWRILLPHHVAELRRSGLRDDIISAAGIYSEPQSQEVRRLLNHQRYPGRCLPALVFHYPGTDNYCRVKPDNPRTVAGKLAKYESPRGRANELYFPPGVVRFFDDPEEDLLITEGEKKALKATQESFPTIGLVGIYGWKPAGAEELLAGFDRINLIGRRVYIVFDSDVGTNPDVVAAESRLAQALKNRGANVRVVRLPAAENGDKVGLDDFLVARGVDAFQELVDAAIEPVPVEAVHAKASAQELDSAIEAERILAATRVDGIKTRVFWRGRFHHWVDNRYREISSEEIRGDVIRQLTGNYFKLKKSHTDNVIDVLKAFAQIPSSVDQPAWLGDSPPCPAGELLSLRNGLLNLNSLAAGENSLVAPTPRFFSPHALDYDFVADAPAPMQWLEFLDQIFPGDRESIATLQEWFALCLTLETRYQVILALIGRPRSGKGTIARVLTKLVGEQNVVGPTLNSFADKSGLEPLIGKGLAIISDARLGRSDQAAIIERMLSISGEDAQTIFRKYIPAWTGKLPTRLMILTNELPRFQDASGALVSRLRILRFEQNFTGHEDRTLFDRLVDELPGILLWAIAGWSRLKSRGRFEQPASGLELLVTLRDLMSPVGAFVRECCLEGPEHEVEIGTLFSRWQRWCTTNGRREPGTVQGFGRDLRSAVAGIRDYRPTGPNGERPHWYRGIALRDS